MNTLCLQIYTLCKLAGSNFIIIDYTDNRDISRTQQFLHIYSALSPNMFTQTIHFTKATLNRRQQTQEGQDQWIGH